VDEIDDPAPRPHRRRFTAAEKLAHLDAYEALPKGSDERGSYLHREGLYSSHLSEWRKQRERSVLAGLAPKGRPAKRTAEQVELEQLRRRNKAHETELERTKTALEITGKVHALLEAISESADTEPRLKPCSRRATFRSRRNSTSSARSSVLSPSERRPSSRSAWRSQFRRQLSEIPRPLAISATGLSPTDQDRPPVDGTPEDVDVATGLLPETTTVASELVSVNPGYFQARLRCHTSPLPFSDDLDRASVTTERLLTPSKITAWLDCDHYLTLRHRVDEGSMAKPDATFGSMARMLSDKGLEHEKDCLAGYRSRGLSVFEVPKQDREGGESFAHWVGRVGNPLADGHDVIYQMPFVHAGVRGIADFLIRVVDPATSTWGYEPVDAKLARKEAKPGHVLQLCFYADAIEALTGHRARRIHLWLGSGDAETLLADDFRPYWRSLRGRLVEVMDQEPTSVITVPESNAHCDYCEFAGPCTDQWRAADALHYVAGIRRPDRDALGLIGVSTMAALATQTGPVPGLRADRLVRIVGQAVLQVEARDGNQDAPPPFVLTEPIDDSDWGKGFTKLPEPDHADVFLDFEGHPFWRADTGLFFLFGWIEQEGAEWVYRAFWAHDQDQERVATEALIDYLADRRAEHPGMHVYHYNHTERSELEKLAEKHAVRESALADLVDTGLFIDLLVVTRNAMQVGAETYGLKDTERLTDFERGHDIDKGAGAVLEYEAWTKQHDQDSLDRIASYNEDDVRATRALRDWLINHRPNDLEWREAHLVPDEQTFDIDKRVAALHAFASGTPGHLLGHLLGYWQREWRAYKMPKLVKLEGETGNLLDEPEVLAGLRFIGEIPCVSEKTGKPLKDPAQQFELPPQDTSGFRADKTWKVMYAGPDGMTGFAPVHRLEPEDGIVELQWTDRAQKMGVIPTAVAFDDWVPAKPKPDALAELADQVIDPVANGDPNPVSLALLRRDLPAFSPGGGPVDDRFTDDLPDMCQWVTELDHSFMAIQGPPGTGKTYSGSHLILALIRDGKRVGITAMSHHAIDNLLRETVTLFEKEGELDRLRAMKKVSNDVEQPIPHVKYTRSNKACANPDFNLVAGTTWLFAGNDMAGDDAAVDVLLIDEAGQLALADAVVASRSATNVVLLGDPLQLAQVAQASHPDGAGASVLEHVLGDGVTISAERGVFLTETRRMHPDVCRFISDQIYEGLLTSHPSCAIQATAFGTGLRWIRADHADCSTESVEEAELVGDEICRLLGSEWTDQHGVTSDLAPEHFMVVAPYNDQVRLIRARLDADPRTEGVEVGTVDKFQGRQAAVVFFTMTTSSSEDMTRSADFLFSRNRLNVAVSRAHCLAYLVCTKELIDSRARDVPEMRLISTLCNFIEHSSLRSDPSPKPAASAGSEAPHTGHP